MHEDGIPAASRLYLPKLEDPPSTVLDYLIARFPRMRETTWRDRVSRGAVRFESGALVTPRSLYEHGKTVLYRREVPNEPQPDEEEVVLYQDGELLVVDKPHGMVVSPTGNHLERSLLVRLQRRTGLKGLAPLHRIDQDTAGLVLFSVNPNTRGAYHQMFPERRVAKEYLAVANLDGEPDRREWRIENRIVEAEPWYRRKIVDGPVNAVTAIRLVEARGSAGLFEIRPETGKQHQIRVHMASLGFPIAGDPLYPKMRPRPVADGPLQLLARRLSFTDPVDGGERTFISERTLRW